VSLPPQPSLSAYFSRDVEKNQPQPTPSFPPSSSPITLTTIPSTTITQEWTGGGRPSFPLLSPIMEQGETSMYPSPTTQLNMSTQPGHTASPHTSVNLWPSSIYLSFFLLLTLTISLISC
jgi:hypothetical protein